MQAWIFGTFLGDLSRSEKLEIKIVARTEHDALVKSRTKIFFKFCGLLRKPKLYDIVWPLVPYSNHTYIPPMIMGSHPVGNYHLNLNYACFLDFKPNPGLKWFIQMSYMSVLKQFLFWNNLTTAVYWSILNSFSQYRVVTDLKFNSKYV